MFDWFARQLGAEPTKFSVINNATPGLIGYALADRAAATGAGVLGAESFRMRLDSD